MVRSGNGGSGRGSRGKTSPPVDTRLGHGCIAPVPRALLVGHSGDVEADLVGAAVLAAAVATGVHVVRLLLALAGTRDAQERRREGVGLTLRVEDMKGLVRDARGDDDKVLVREYQADLKTHLAKAKDLAEKIQEIKAGRLNGKDAVATFEQFHELLQNIANSIQNLDSMADLDFVMRKLFMNLTVTDQKITGITQNSPFCDLYETKTILHNGESVVVNEKPR